MPIYTRNNIRLLHIHMCLKTGRVSITEQFFEEGWTVTYHNRLETTKSTDYPEPSQHLHYERLTESKVFDSLATTIDGMTTVQDSIYQLDSLVQIGRTTFYT